MASAMSLCFPGIWTAQIYILCCKVKSIKWCKRSIILGILERFVLIMLTTDSLSQLNLIRWSWRFPQISHATTIAYQSKRPQAKTSPCQNVPNGSQNVPNGSQNVPWSKRPQVKTSPANSQKRPQMIVPMSK